MAVRDEGAALTASVEAILVSGYRGDLEVVIAVGPSDDDTAEVCATLADRYGVVVIDNPTGLTPHGLNAAIAHARHSIVVRMDGHALMPVGYVDTAVDALQRTGAANVGGRMVPTADAPFPKAVAVAMATPWGLGSPDHRSGGREGPTSSVYLGSFQREALERVGGYDEHFTRAQDWELNYRLREAGDIVWFVPQMQVPYSPRSTWRSLAAQMYHTGRWRREVFHRHPGSRSVRYMVAPVLALALTASVIAAVVAWAAGQAWTLWPLVVPAAYVTGVLAVSTSFARTAGAATAARLPVVLPTIHVAWGLGFLRGVR